MRRTAFVLLGTVPLLAGCNGQADLPREDPNAVKVGAIIPLSREYESLGATQRLAYGLAQEAARRQRRPALKLVFGDSQLRDLRTEQVYRRLVSQDKVVAFVEVTGNALALKLEENAVRDKVP